MCYFTQQPHVILPLNKHPQILIKLDYGGIITFSLKHRDIKYLKASNIVGMRPCFEAEMVSISKNLLSKLIAIPFFSTNITELLD